MYTLFLIYSMGVIHSRVMLALMRQFYLMDIDIGSNTDVGWT